MYLFHKKRKQFVSCNIELIYPLDERVLHIANIGDTRAILVSNDGVERITVDHKATDPKEILRIQ